MLHFRQAIPTRQKMHFEVDGAGLIPSEEDQPHHPPHPIFDHPPVNKNLLVPGLFPSISYSEPHLHLTQLFHHNEDQPLSTFFGEASAAQARAAALPHVAPDHLHLMAGHPQNPYFAELRSTTPSLSTSASSAALLDVQPAGAPLRKSSSAVDWSFFTDSSKDTTFHQLAERPGAFLEGGRKRSTIFPQLSHLGTIRKEEPALGGLVMSVGATGAAPSSSSCSSSSSAAAVGGHYDNHKMSSFAGHQQNAGGQSLVAAASAALQGSSTSTSLVSSSSGMSSNPLMPSSSTSSTASGTPINPLEAAKAGEHALSAAQQEHKHGMLGSVFKQGFFGRPVLQNNEESYRYIMALDR